MVQLYIGSGKGKTTALLGLLLRARGAGLRCALFRFFKWGESSELAPLRSLGVDVFSSPAQEQAFLHEMTKAQKEQCLQAQRRLFEECALAIGSGQYDMVALDEGIYLPHLGAVADEELVHILRHCPPDVELVLSGNNPSQALLCAADYISDIHAKKHPYSLGQGPRKGIEF